MSVTPPEKISVEHLHHPKQTGNAAPLAAARRKVRQADLELQIAQLAEYVVQDGKLYRVDAAVCPACKGVDYAPCRECDDGIHLAMWPLDSVVFL